MNMSNNQEENINNNNSDNFKFSCSLEVIKGDITQLNVDVIVNAANRGGGGVDGAIQRAAGPKLIEKCRQIANEAYRQNKLPLPPGTIQITEAFNITNVKYIFHACGPRNQDPNVLANCYKESLDSLANRNGKPRGSSIAFPCISTGVYGYPNDKAAMVAIDTVKKWLKLNADLAIKINKIIFCCFLDEDYEIYKSLLCKDNRSATTYIPIELNETQSSAIKRHF